jgi:hypothetical protein
VKRRIDHVAVEVDDVDAAAAELRAHGVRFGGTVAPRQSGRRSCVRHRQAFTAPAA